MSEHRCSPEDAAFRRRFEAGGIEAGSFDHAAHLRLAYIHLCEADCLSALPVFRSSLQAFLAHIGAPADKYHETVTRAWLALVATAMDGVHPCTSAAEFLSEASNDLSPTALSRYYSRERLGTAAARERFVPPDLAPMPPCNGDNDP